MLTSIIEHSKHILEKLADLLAERNLEPEVYIEKVHQLAVLKTQSVIAHYKGICEKMLLHINELKEIYADTKYRLYKIKEKIWETDYSNGYVLFITLATAVLLTGEIVFAYDTIAMGFDMEGFQGLFVALSVGLMILAAEIFLGLWFFDHLGKPASANYPRKLGVLIGAVTIMVLLGMVVGIGLFRAEFLSWDIDDYFGTMMKDDRELAWFIVGSLTLGFFTSATIIVGWTTAIWKNRYLNRKASALEKYLAEISDRIGDELTQLEEAKSVIDNSESIKISLQNSYELEYLTRYLDRLKAIDKENELTEKARLVREKEEADKLKAELEKETENIEANRFIDLVNAMLKDEALQAVSHQKNETKRKN